MGTNFRYGKATIALIGFCILTASKNLVAAQELISSQTKLEPLNIGDVLPDIPLEKMINYKSSKSKTSDFKGKLTILDFWGINCQACINAMPELQKFQVEFKDRMNIILVTSDKEREVKTVLSKSPFAKGTYFPFVVEDNVLKRLFPHKIIPHEVWLDEKGKILAITSHKEVTRENILAVIERRTVKFPTKTDNVEWSWNKILGGAINIDDQESVKIYHSLFAKYIPGSPTATAFKQDNSGLSNGVYFSNADIIKMYYLTFSKLTIGIMGTVNAKRIISEIKDSFNFKRYTSNELAIGPNDIPFKPKTFPYLKWQNQEEWISESYFSYDLQLPFSVSNTLLRDYIFQDLSRVSPIKAKVEKRSMDAWVIHSSDSSAVLLKTKGNIKSIRIRGKEGEFGVLNLPFSEFVKDLNLFWQVDPIVDESNTKTPVDLIIDFSNSALFNRKLGIITNSPLDFEILIKELNKYGLSLKKEKRMVDMLVVYD